MASSWQQPLHPKWVVLFAMCLLECIQETWSSSVPKNTSLPGSLQLSLQYRDVELHHARAQDVERRGLLGEAEMKIYGSVLKRGYYYVPLMLGTPPQDFALIVDTGSTVTYVPCSMCTHCGKHADPRFTPSESSTYQPLPCSDPECESHQCDSAQQCRYQRHYAEQSSTSGLVATDVVDFFASHTLGAPRVMFGCELIETGDLYSQQADGITGLGRGHFSIVTQMAKQGAMDDVFSLCYGGMEKGNGMMVLGADEVPFDMHFTPFDPTRERSPYYSLVIEGLSVGGSALSLPLGAFRNGYGAVLDSGTTFTYLPGPVWSQFEKQFLAGMKLPRVAGPDPKYPDVCFSGAGENLAEVAQHFPAVSFEMGGWQGGTWSLELAPENFMFKHSDMAGAYCLGIFENQDAGSLIGGITVRNMLVRYDRKNNRFGFARRQCADLLGSLKPASSAPSTSISASEPTPVFPSATESPSGTEPEPTGTGAPGAVSSPPPEAYVPVASEIPQEGAEAPMEVVVEACATCPVGEIHASMEIPIDYDTWDRFQQIFVDDVSQQLQVAPSQVEVVDVRKASSSPGGIVVEFVVRPAPGLTSFETVAEQRIVGSLQRNEVELPTVFGEYSVKSVQRLPAVGETASKTNAETAGKTVGILAGVAVLLAILGFLGYKRWTKQKEAKYVTMEQIEEGDGEREGLRNPENDDIELTEP